MDTVTLLKELFGEEPIKKVVNSGFDTVGKIAAASPESLAFFAGIHEALAKQIIASAEESTKSPASKGYRAALSGATPLPVSPRSGSAPSDAPTSKEGSRTPAGTEQRESQEDPIDPEETTPDPVPAIPLDDHPRLDAGQILKTVASERCADEVNADTALLEGLGLSDAETLFLEGESPWSRPADQDSSAVGITGKPVETPPEPEEPTAAGERKGAQEPVEWAPVSNWSPEKDPDPVPRVVRAPELGPDPTPESETEPTLGVSDPMQEPEPVPEVPESPLRSAGAVETSPKMEQKAPESIPPNRPSFWRFGK